MASRSSAEKRIADALNDAKCLNLSENDDKLLSNMIYEYFDDGSATDEELSSDEEDENLSESDDDHEDVGEVGLGPGLEDQAAGDVGLEGEDLDEVQDETWAVEGEESFMVDDLADDNFKRNSGFNCCMSEDDAKEMEKIRSKRCRCHNPYRGLGCSHKFTDEWVFQVRCQMNSLSPDLKTMFLLGKVASAGIRTTDLTQSKKQVNTKRKRGRTKLGYYVDGVKVCRDIFCFIHMISDKTLTALVKHYIANGIELKLKKSGGANNNAHKFSAEDHKRAAGFITRYAETHALVIPGRVPGFKSADPRTRLLPSSTNKAKVWRLYKKELQEMRDPDGKEYRTLGRSSFYGVWNLYCPYVRTTKPRTDLCWTCQRHNRKIYQSANQTEAEKQQLLDQQREHLRVVQQEREIFQQESAAAKMSVEQEETDIGPHEPCSRKGSMHYSFDYAQQIFYPHDPEQPGPTYFLVARKCGVFGIHCEGVTKQVNFLVDEAIGCGKGSNSVVSYLDFYFGQYSLGEEFLQLHCDNCAGQNKNRIMMAYLCWRTIHGFHKRVEIKFLVAGHTKFSPDWCFGLFKQKYRRSHVSCLDDIANVCRHSTYKEVNIPQIMGNEDGTVIVPTRNWKDFLSDYFKPLPKIKELHHMRFDSENPGMVFVKRFGDDEEHSHQLLKNPDVLPPRELPAELEPPGLSETRKQYLFETIRQFCAQDGRQDITCPDPDSYIR